MADDIEVWKPGSFTKNFSWGRNTPGLSQLHSVIRAGFGDASDSVLRSEFRARAAESNRPDYIPLNFFLFNTQENGVDKVAFDELVFQAVSFEHSRDFDRLAVFALVLSIAGTWRGARAFQDRPALWARAYIKERLGAAYKWDVSAISADDIQEFIESDPRWQAETSRKLATNLRFLLEKGDIAAFSSPKVTRWWVNALFLTLDRLVLERRLKGLDTSPEQYPRLLASVNFIGLSGPRSIEKELAQKHLCKLYHLTGGVDRFSAEVVRELTELTLPDIERYLANSDRPIAAIHFSNPAILKTMPRACAMLAQHADFEYIDADDLQDFNVETFIREKAGIALQRLKERGIRPSMTAAQLMKLTRGE